MAGSAVCAFVEADTSLADCESDAGAEASDETELEASDETVAAAASLLSVCCPVALLQFSNSAANATGRSIR